MYINTSGTGKFYVYYGVMKMEEKPRYSRVSDIISLLLLMQSKLNGVSLADIQEEFNVSRRTAERMRDSVLNILPQIEELETDERCKRWGFRNFSLSELVTFLPDEIASLEKLKNNCDELTGKDLQSVITKIKALNRRHIGKLEDEIELLLQSEGCAVRQAPVYKFDLNNVSVIRQGIKENFKISAEYKGRHKILSPLGLIFGEKVHLIAREEQKGSGEYNYLLHKLKNVKLTSEHFDADGFILQEFAQRSFGVYQGEIFDVKLKFSSEVAEDVLHYNFHPTQEILKQRDGSFIVTFKASGEKHIMWHLFKWGAAVEILEPEELKNKYREYLKEVLDKV